MKKYRAKFNPERKGVYAISLVDEPAMEGDFVQFKKQEKEVKFAVIDEEKSRVMGLILEPDKEILRFNEETQEHYTVQFTKQDVKDVAYNFQEQSNQNNSTLQHDGKPIKDVTFVELWLVEDSKIDKSAKFGFNYPVGSWIGVMEIKNKEVLEEVKLGKYKGFSIDALMEFEEINLNKLNMDVKNEGSFIELLKELPSKIALALQPKEKEVKLEKIELEEKEKKEDEDEDEEKVKLADVDDDMVNSVLADLVTKIQEMIAPVEEASVELSKKVDALELKVTKQKEELVEFGKEPATKSARRTNSVDKVELSSYQKFRQHNKQFNK